MQSMKVKISSDIPFSIALKIRNRTNTLSTHIRRYSNLRSINDLSAANLMLLPTSLKCQIPTQNSKIVPSKEEILLV